MADRVRKPEWLKINIGANERYTETKQQEKYYFRKGLQKGTLRPAYTDSVRA